jgi:hypothetical protein
VQVGNAVTYLPGKVGLSGSCLAGQESPIFRRSGRPAVIISFAIS